VATKNEKLGDIEDVWIICRRRAASDQRESRNPGIASDEEWKPALRL
jgi:hypothetical protein